jgi:DNA (cytosine-5)-methyltransferase 1
VQREVRVLDLFCGAAGGWSLGLHRAGFRTVAACEADPWRRDAYSINFPGVPVYDDVRTLTADRLEGDGIAVDVVVGSPPCQDASVANSKGKGVDGERTGLFFEAIRLVGELRPGWACFENSPGLRTRGYDRIHGALEAIGYAVRPLVVGAWHAGAPHIRNRVWIIANAREALHVHEQPRGSEWADRGGQEIPARPDSPDTIGSIARRWSETGRRLGWQETIARWPNWNGGAPECDVLDDGLSQAMARPLLSAYGDAVVPIIPELIGRAIMNAGACNDIYRE